MKKTKKALLTSVFALILSVAMLAGSTMAWFTDTASSTGNKIIAGNLDVDLLMAPTADGNYVSIANQSAAIFDGGANANNSNTTLWEPGATHVAYLAVRNNGNLALKYNIVIDVDDYGLVGSLEYAIVPLCKKIGEAEKPAATQNIANWADAKAKGGNAQDVVAGRFTAAETGCLDEIANNKDNKNETDYFALVVHMKEDAGNEYQGKNVTIDVNVVATQKDAEEDAFGSEYDKNSTLPTVAEKINGSGIVEGIRKSNIENQVKVDDGGSTESVSIKIVKTETDQVTPQVVGNATVPAVAAIGVLDSITADTEIFKQTVNQGDTEDKVLVLALNVKTFEKKVDSVKLDISMNASVTRTVTPSEGTAVVETKKTNVNTLNEAVTVNVQLPKGLEDVSVTHTHANDAPVEMEAVADLSNLVDGKFHYDKEAGVLTLKTSKFSKFEITYVSPEVCHIDTKPYSSLDEAIAAYNTGEVIVLSKDITSANIEKDVIVTANGQSLTAVVASGKTLTINEGTFKTLTVTGDGKCKVAGGTFTALTGSSTSTLKLSGGKFYSADPTTYVLGGYIATLNQETNPSYWTVAKKPVDNTEVKISKQGEADTYMSLAGFRDSVNAGKTYEGYTVTLQKDINLDGEEDFGMIGTSDVKFAGIFDGNNKKISNLTITNNNGIAAMFYGISDGVVIKNLTLANVLITGKYACALVGDAEKTKNFTISKVEVASGTVAGASYGSSIVFDLEGSGVIIEHCINRATISGKFSGGLVAYATGCEGLTMDNCKNYGNVNGADNAGGIIGQSTNVTYTNCSNYGKISATEGSWAQAYAGGIVGSGQTGTIITNCYNEGNVSAVQGSGGEWAAFAGGINGMDNGTAVITYCINVGNVSSNGDASGITGYSNAYTSNISHCYNSGSISAVQGYCAAGIAGRTTSNCITKCVNAGNVSGQTKTYLLGITNHANASYYYDGAMLKTASGDAVSDIDATVTALNTGIETPFWGNDNGVIKPLSLITIN